MNFEIGKRYPTRGGGEATLVYKLNRKGEPLVFVHHGDVDVPRSHALAGEYYCSGTSTSDIISDVPLNTPLNLVPGEWDSSNHGVVMLVHAQWGAKIVPFWFAVDGKSYYVAKSGEYYRYDSADVAGSITRPHVRKTPVERLKEWRASIACSTSEWKEFDAIVAEMKAPPTK